jgi:parvulin-like peptidyl-prolyl isomerase
MRQLIALALTFLAIPVTVEVARAADVAVPKGSVAVVAGEPVTHARLDELVASARRSYAWHGRRFPARRTAAYRRIQDEAVRFLVDWAQIGQQAADLGVTATDAQVAGRIAAIKRLYFHGSDALYRRELARQGLTADQARENVRRQLVSQGIYRAVVGDAESDGAAAVRWADWIDALHSRYAALVAYAPGFEPSR